ncbi:ABC transporter permease [Streptomyces sp. NPDC051018]|uniref:ABC transporter permease n=1 Tax=Streptomyces sp. NPDC051018 TaxID=3365639 RepID=UPI00379F8189
MNAPHAEWTKLRTLPSTWWLLLAAVVLPAAVSALTAGSLSTEHCRAPDGCHEDIVKQSLTGVWAGQAAVVVLAVLTMSGEYGTGTIRTSLTAVPGRARLLAAKAGVLSAVVAAAAAPAVLGSLLAGRALLPGSGFTPYSLTDGSTVRAGVGTVLYLVLVALFSLGVATLLRDTAGSVTLVLGLLYAFPLFSEVVTDPRWVERLQRVGPGSAGLAIQATTDLHLQPIAPWSGLAVLAGYAVGALLVGWTSLRLRDA